MSGIRVSSISALERFSEKVFLQSTLQGSEEGHRGPSHCARGRVTGWESGRTPLWRWPTKRCPSEACRHSSAPSAPIAPPLSTLPTLTPITVLMATGPGQQLAGHEKRRPLVGIQGLSVLAHHPRAVRSLFSTVTALPFAVTPNRNGRYSVPPDELTLSGSNVR